MSIALHEICEICTAGKVLRFTLPANINHRNCSVNTNYDKLYYMEDNNLKLNYICSRNIINPDKRFADYFLYVCHGFHFTITFLL